MFTGIVEEAGVVQAVKRRGKGNCCGGEDRRQRGGERLLSDGDGGEGEEVNF